jgi:hypothetical protein
MVARVLRVLLEQDVRPEQVVARAVGLGLLRQPAAGAAPLLSALVVARLFLAGYRIPATVEAGTLRSLHEHLRAGRCTFLLLAAPGGSASEAFELFQVCRGATDERLLLSEPGRPADVARFAASEELAAPWAAAACFLICGLRSWGHLPTSGRTFFGGSRDRDGSYHWYTAECDTDAEGRILRY